MVIDIVEGRDETMCLFGLSGSR
jgi:hypothetical protein